MAVVVENNVPRMSSENPHVYPVFRTHNVDDATVPSQLPPLQQNSLQSARPSSIGLQNDIPTREEQAHERVSNVTIDSSHQKEHGRPEEVRVNDDAARPQVANGLQFLMNTRNTNPDTSEPQAKRRRIASELATPATRKQGLLPWAKPSVTADEVEQNVPVSTDVKQEEQSTQTPAQTPAQSERSIHPPNTENDTKPTTPTKKLMKLRTDGRLFSPSKKDTHSEQKKRGRKGTSPKQILVVHKYGKDEPTRQEVGEKIEKILRGELRIKPLPGDNKSKPVSIKITSATPTKKPAYALFVRNDNSPPEQPFSRVRSRHESHFSRNSSPQRKAHDIPASKPSGLMFGTSSAKFVFPPECENPIWPPSEMDRVRSGSPDLGAPYIIETHNLRKPIQKSKEAQVRMDIEEEVLFPLRSLVADRELAQQAHEDDFMYPMPIRQITNRRKLLDLVAGQLTTGHATNSEPTSAYGQLPGVTDFTSSAAKRLFETLSSARSAFDEFKCETQEWTTKYSPRTTADVLQPSIMMQSLRDWISGNAVHSTSVSNSQPVKKKRQSLKRRKHASELDDFIVASEDEDVGEPGFDWVPLAPDTSRYRFKKTVPRLDHASPLRPFCAATSKQTKAVILSGPHGCGKTAAVYAIAQELGSEIFEINPGNRRSGKDILEKVGDMTKNHLVSQTSAQSGDEERSSDERPPNIKEVQEQIASGKQSTMASFFKAKPASKATNPKPAPCKQPLKAEPAAERKKATKHQKQSLILIEEIDVLFEEDKQFWSTVVALIATSRRPVIMTCNDESRLPFEELQDCSLLRLEPSEESSAVDYLILLAAHEGHLLNRSAVTSLYAQTDRDLRASTKQLNFWCQMAINDPTGGLNWMLLPRDYVGTGIDVADQRVLSSGTYTIHTGMLGRNVSRSEPEPIRVSSRLIDAISELDLTLNDIDDIITGQENLTREPLDLMADLEALTASYEMLSVADVISNSVFQARSLADLDTAPDMSEQHRSLGYTNSPRLLHGLDESVTNQDWDITATLAQLAQAQLSRSCKNGPSPFSHDDLCASIVDRRATITQHCKLIMNTMHAALKPLSTGPLANKNTIIDTAPYARSIVAYDARLEQERARLNNLLSDGSQPSKRQRTTRAARAALEGGHKSSTRRERWFEGDLNSDLILETAGAEWSETAWKQYETAARKVRWARQAEQTESSEDELAT